MDKTVTTLATYKTRKGADNYLARLVGAFGVDEWEGDEIRQGRWLARYYVDGLGPYTVKCVKRRA